MFNRSLLIKSRTRKVRRLLLLATPFRLQDSAVKFGRVSEDGNYVHKQTPISPIGSPRRRHNPTWER